jgi:hypothetical protein
MGVRFKGGGNLPLPSAFESVGRRLVEQDFFSSCGESRETWSGAKTRANWLICRNEWCALEDSNL